jgi:hypothetical protein
MAKRETRKTLEEKKVCGVILLHLKQRKREERN